jgi:hypothetical protein
LYLLTGSLTHFDPQRLQASTTLLYNDLRRQGLGGVTFETNVTLSRVPARCWCRFWRSPVRASDSQLRFLAR